uniref:Uncharacterized protein n=1 Tax=Rhizophora mucronata TaxID=61149 RepID=A0A2P2ILS9_RHIMU
MNLVGLMISIVEQDLLGELVPLVMAELAQLSCSSC